MLFSFVILHYRAVDETIKCVESIKKTQQKSYHIVIVDNNSPDNSGQQLDSLYEGDNHITILHNTINEGFARGNNVGFRYSKYKLKADFIILQNNDTQVLQENFQDIVINEYNLSSFAVLGPLIKTPHPPFNSNPRSNKLPDINYVKRRLFNHRILLFLNYLHLDHYVLNIISKRNHIKKDFNNLNSQIASKLYNVCLHGSFMVFSPSYIRIFDGLNDKTFLYCEEELLYLRIINNHLKTVYLPDVIIFHKEDASTNAEFNKGLKKRRFQYHCIIQSFKVMIDELQKS